MIQFVPLKLHNDSMVWINPAKVAAVYEVSQKGCIGIDMGDGTESYVVRGDHAGVIRKLGGRIFASDDP